MLVLVLVVVLGIVTDKELHFRCPDTGDLL
jgi:hypothetical protein